MPRKITTFSYWYKLLSFSFINFTIVHIFMRKCGTISVFSKNICFALCMKIGDFSQWKTHISLIYISWCLVKSYYPFPNNYNDNLYFMYGHNQNYPRSLGFFLIRVGFCVGFGLVWFELVWFTFLGERSTDVCSVLQHLFDFCRTPSQDSLTWYKISCDSGSSEMNGCICF